jgi:signal transduction histidine kinase
VKWLRSQTIRARITISSVLIGAVLIAIAAVGFRTSVDAIVAGSTRTLLASDAAPYEASIGRSSVSTFPQPDENQLIAVVDPSGKLRVASLPDSLTDRIKSLLRLSSGLHVVQTSRTQYYDVSNELVFGQGGEWHVIAARNRAAGQIVLSDLDSLLVAGGLALIAGFGIASWLVTGLALRPVSRMRRQAKLLSQTATTGMLPVGPVRDELSALAATLNAFITSVRSSADRERQMVADASHELRTPIAVLTTQLQLAHLSSGDADALEREIEAAEQTLARLSALTTSLLTLSRIEAAEADATVKAPETAASDILTEFLASMDRAIVLGSSHGVGVDFTTGGVDENTTVRILGSDFAGLVDNLVANAIAASSRGSSVEVNLAGSGHLLTLSVVDSGHGIPADFLPIAFDRFSRTELSRTNRIGGSGLGLAIVKAIVSRSGGEVRLEQRSEGGVRAIVELPVSSLRH